MEARRFACAAAAAACTVCAGQTPLTTVRVASGLTRPVFVGHAPGDFSRVFIVEQRGSGGVFHQADIRVLDLASGALRPQPFLRLTGVYTTATEKGLYTIAFHPDYAANGWFYVHYTTADEGRGERIVIERYTVSADPDIADPQSAHVVLEIPHPGRYHHGGTLEFGPDGRLYVTIGDGGAQGDPDHNAQNPELLLGKILRIDVNGDDFPDDPLRNYAVPPTNPFVGAGGADEVWASGLRNPWRCAFDRATGDLWITDVGQNDWEEIDFQPAASAGGENYGWRCYEGHEPFNLAGCDAGVPMVFPVHAYAHNPSCAVTGGYVYRGCAIPDLHGAYFFADYCSGQIWSLRYDGAAVTELIDRTAELDPGLGTPIGRIASFGLDAFGEIYICDSGTTDGAVYRIVPDAPPANDCNANGSPDACDILSGASADLDADGVPDECEPDCNANGRPDDLDISDGTSLDLDADGIPDECEPDCNGNSRPDDLDIADGTSADLNANGVPDECEPDCNHNGVPDDLDISSGTSIDGDGDGVPDECQCRADVNLDGRLTLDDFVQFRNIYVAGDLAADLDGSGTLTLDDFVTFRNLYVAGCP